MTVERGCAKCHHNAPLSNVHLGHCAHTHPAKHRAARRELGACAAPGDTCAAFRRIELMLLVAVGVGELGTPSDH